MFNRVYAVLLGFLLSMLSMAARAEEAGIDITAATSGINEAKVAILALLSALLSLSVSLFGLSKVYAFVKRKAGG